jgi:hypothetical protein
MVYFQAEDISIGIGWSAGDTITFGLALSLSLIYLETLRKLRDGG